MDDTGTRGYLAYMLRLRRTDGAHPAWRPSLEAVATGERHVFGTLDEMAEWLRAKVGEEKARGSDDEEKTGGGS